MEDIKRRYYKASEAAKILGVSYDRLRYIARLMGYKSLYRGQKMRYALWQIEAIRKKNIELLSDRKP